MIHLLFHEPWTFSEAFSVLDILLPQRGKIKKMFKI